MLIISNGMIKSGSTLAHLYTVAMFECAQPGNAQKIWRRLIQGGRFNGAGDFVRCVDRTTFREIVQIAKNVGPFVAKMHIDVDREIMDSIDRGDVKVNYTIRDPRDLVLSAIDHRLRSAAGGESRFGRFQTCEDSLRSVRQVCDGAIRWIRSDRAFIVRYERMLEDGRGVAMAINRYHSMGLNDKDIERVVAAEAVRKVRGRNQLNKGLLTRHESEMPLSIRESYRTELSSELLELGYEAN